MEKYFEEKYMELLSEGIDEECIRTKKGIVLSVSPYKVEEKGTTVEGMTVMYMYTKHLNPTNIPNSKGKGIKVGKISLPQEMLPEFKHVPGYYDILITEQAGSNMSMVLKPKAMHYLGTLDLNIKLENAVPEAAVVQKNPEPVTMQPEEVKEPGKAGKK